MPRGWNWRCEAAQGAGCGGRLGPWLESAGGADWRQNALAGERGFAGEGRGRRQRKEERWGETVGFWREKQDACAENDGGGDGGE